MESLLRSLKSTHFSSRAVNVANHRDPTNNQTSCRYAAYVVFDQVFIPQCRSISTSRPAFILVAVSKSLLIRVLRLTMEIIVTTLGKLIYQHSQYCSPPHGRFHHVVLNKKVKQVPWRACNSNTRTWIKEDIHSKVPSFLGMKWKMLQPPWAPQNYRFIFYFIFYIFI